MSLYTKEVDCADIVLIRDVYGNGLIMRITGTASTSTTENEEDAWESGSSTTSTLVFSSAAGVQTDVVSGTLVDARAEVYNSSPRVITGSCSVSIYAIVAYDLANGIVIFLESDFGDFSQSDVDTGNRTGISVSMKSWVHGVVTVLDTWTWDMPEAMVNIYADRLPSGQWMTGSMSLTDPPRSHVYPSYFFDDPGAQQGYWQAEAHFLPWEWGRYHVFGDPYMNEPPDIGLLDTRRITGFGPWSGGMDYWRWTSSPGYFEPADSPLGWYRGHLIGKDGGMPKCMMLRGRFYIARVGGERRLYFTDPRTRQLPLKALEPPYDSETSPLPTDSYIVVSFANDPRRSQMLAASGLTNPDFLDTPPVY